MGKIIDADILFAAMESSDWYNNADRDEVAERLVLETPEAVVRCKDCLLFHPHAIEDARFGDCDAWDTKTAKHGFCFLGKRKANE